MWTACANGRGTFRAPENWLAYISEWKRAFISFVSARAARLWIDQILSISKQLQAYAYHCLAELWGAAVCCTACIMQCVVYDTCIVKKCNRIAELHRK